MRKRKTAAEARREAKERAEVAAFDWGRAAWSFGESSERAQQLRREMWRAFRTALRKRAR